MAPQQQDTDALIIDNRDYKESDKIITLLCKDFGRISCIVKGAKNSKKRFVNKLELFSFLHITFTDYPNRSLAFLNEAELHTAFIEIRNSSKLFTFSSIIQEFLLQATKEREADFSLFQLSLWAFHNLNQQQPPPTVLTLFLIRLYDILGYRPNLSDCQRCEKSSDNGINFSFQLTTGSLICQTCSKESHQKILSPGTIKFLRAAQDQPIERLHRIKADRKVIDEALQLLHLYGRNILQRDIISWRMLQNNS